MKIRMRDGLGTIKLKYLVEDVDRHGNVRLYVRRHGRKVRIRETPGTDEFLAAYRAALGSLVSGRSDNRSSHPTAPGSLRWLVECYYGSAEFGRLGESTRRARRGILDSLCEQHGTKPFARMEPRHVRILRDEKVGLPEAANDRVKAVRHVFAWATEAGHAQHNPAREVAYIRTGSEGIHTWTVEEVTQYEVRHHLGTKARLVLGLLLYTGVRRSDVVKLGRQMERDGWLRFTETKGRARHVKAREIQILPELRTVLDATPSEHLTYITTPHGKSYSRNGFSNWFRRRCNEAGLRHCSAHGLRKAGATIAAENGATEHQLMAIYGWESPKQAAIYTRKANRKRLAAGAMHLLVPTETVPLSGVVQSGGTSRGKKS